MALPLLPRQIYPGRQLTSLSKCRWRGASECHSIIHNATSRIRGSLSDRSVHADMEMFTGSTSCHASHPRRTVRLQDSSNGVEGFFFPIFLLFFFFFLLTIPGRKSGGNSKFSREKWKSGRERVHFPFHAGVGPCKGSIRLSINFCAA